MVLFEPDVPPSGGSLEIGNAFFCVIFICVTISSPFGGIPRNWKHPVCVVTDCNYIIVPPSGGSLEIGNGDV